MARRNGDMIPTSERTLVFDLNPDNEANVQVAGFYIDLAQCSSLVNRNFQRQGQQIVVESIEIGVQSGGAYEATINRLPEHWPCINAWGKTMRHWMDQQDEAAREAGLQSTEARYRDFKVHFDAAHVTAGVAANLLPSGYSHDPALTGSNIEWNMSQVVLPNAGGSAAPVEVSLHMLGADTGATPLTSTSCGVIQAYAESRSRPQRTDPNIVDVDADNTLYGAMTDVAEIVDDVITNYQEHNHVPPYLIGYDNTHEFYPGGSLTGIAWGTAYALTGTLVDILSVNALTTSNTDRTGLFTAPCGLLKIRLNAANVSVPGVPQAGDLPCGIWMKITLAAGSSKGIMSRPMQEVN